MMKIYNDIIVEIEKLNDIPNEILIKSDVKIFLYNLRCILFLGYLEEIQEEISLYIENKIKEIVQLLSKMLHNLKYSDSLVLSNQFISMITTIKSQLNGDLATFLINDPASCNEHDIIINYPGFFAITLYRIANSLSKLGIKILPRSITQYAHEKTSIDINPKASIGNNFFIDHGTGVVIGESVSIGDNVKIYHGVTLGTLSIVTKDLKNIKRHPTIKDGVTIYSNATILGGTTVIGENSIIGSNVFITRSVNKNSKVIFNTQNNLFKEN